MKRKRLFGGVDGGSSQSPQTEDDNNETNNKGNMGQWIVGKAMPDEPELPQPPNAGIIPKVPFRMLMVGPSHSGKSNFARWLCDNAYKDPKGNPRKSFFDRIFLLSPTANIDYMWSKLNGLQPKDRHTKPTEATLKKILEDAIKAIQGTTSDTVPPLPQKQLHRKKERADKILVIMDDAIAESKLINSPVFLKFFYQCRHYGISVMLMSQSYKKIPRSARIQGTHVAMFPSVDSEIGRLREDFGPRQLDKKEWAAMVTYAITPTPEDPYPFFYIDAKAPLEFRFRRNLYEALSINASDIVGGDSMKKEKEGDQDDDSMPMPPGGPSERPSRANKKQKKTAS